MQNFNQPREKLLAMIAEDERVRAELAQTGELFDGYCPAMEAVHLKNAAALERMIADLGGKWLGVWSVGADGAEAAFRIAMHSISLPDFMRRCLQLLETAVAENDAEPYQAAALGDRIALFEGRPQKYGTQSDWNAAGKMEVCHLENAEMVNEFRAQVGLKPLGNLIWEDEETNRHAPLDSAKRQAEYEVWTRKIGWRN